MYVDAGNECPTANPKQRIYDYDSKFGKLIYEGWAAAGAAVTDPAWAIRRSQWSVDGEFLLRTQWANGTSGESNVWNNRALLSYA